MPYLFGVLRSLLLTLFNFGFIHTLICKTTETQSRDTSKVWCAALASRVRFSIRPGSCFPKYYIISHLFENLFLKGLWDVYNLRDGLKNCYRSRVHFTTPKLQFVFWEEKKTALFCGGHNDCDKMQNSFNDKINEKSKCLLCEKEVYNEKLRKLMQWLCCEERTRREKMFYWYANCFPSSSLHLYWQKVSLNSWNHHLKTMSFVCVAKGCVLNKSVRA